jgi:hypothetical protein
MLYINKYVQEQIVEICVKIYAQDLGQFYEWVRQYM